MIDFKCMFHPEQGVNIGGFNFTMYSTFAVAFLYGCFRVSEGAYTGGKVMNALLGGSLQWLLLFIVFIAMNHGSCYGCLLSHVCAPNAVHATRAESCASTLGCTLAIPQRTACAIALRPRIDTAYVPLLLIGAFTLGYAPCPACSALRIHADHCLSLSSSFLLQAR